MITGDYYAGAAADGMPFDEARRFAGFSEGSSFCIELVLAVKPIPIPSRSKNHISAYSESLSADGLVVLFPRRLLTSNA